MLDTARTLLAPVRTRLEHAHPRRQPPERLAAAAIAVLAAVAAYAIGTTVFPYLSVNHDEGAYLQQAELLVEGQLAMHAGDLADAVRPWFFVQDGGRLYPRYQPYPAVLYAAATALVGEPRVVVAAVAAGNAALVYVVGAAAFDRRVGVVAAALFASAPLTLVTGSLYLPYAPATLLNLAFAACYLRALRLGHTGYAALAGAAIGLAFFARPYTAVLFAAPFVAHAAWQVVASLRAGLRRGRDERTGGDSLEIPEPARRHLVTAALGLAFVGLTLAYNALVTGSPLRFPFQSFAPLDGPGFGLRRVPWHEVEYTLDVALVANGYVVWHLLTRWGPAGALGSALAAAGLALTAARRRPDLVPDLLPTALQPRGEARSGASASTPEESEPAPGESEPAPHESEPSPGESDPAPGESVSAPGDGASALDERESTSDHAAQHTAPTARLLLAGLFPTVIAGNVAFWGNYNLLGPTPAATDGLIASVGPVYHFDLLVPLSVFAAATLVAAWRRAAAWRPEATSPDRDEARPPALAAARTRLAGQRARSVALAAVLLLGVLAAASSAAFVAEPLDRGTTHTAELESVYAPFEERDLSDAVVLLPTPWGEWLNHPFEVLRNDPGLDGPTVYAMDRDAAGDFAVADAYPDRTLYRYTYRGDLEPLDGEHVLPRLERLSRPSGERLAGETTVGVPEGVEHAAVRLETGAGGSERYVVRDPGEELAVAWSVESAGARLHSGPERSTATDGGTERTAAADDGTEHAAATGDGTNASATTGDGTDAPATADDAPLPIADADEVVLLVRLTDRNGATLTYRQVVEVRRTSDGVEALWPPERTVCPLVDDCGRSGTYLPDRPGEHRDGVSFEVELSADA